MPSVPQVICVTGGSGFLGSYCVKLLLERGYRVQTTVRDPTNEKKVGHLKALPGANERLTIFKANLLEEGSFDEAIKDCSVVLHTASPVELKNQNRDQLVAPAVQGTLNVLRSAARTPGIRRVVLTSSMAAVYIHCDTKPVEHVFTEDDWSHEELIEKNKMWYCVSKTLAERAAWNFMENLSDAHFDLVAMCPTWIHGPMLQPELNESSEKIYDYLVGNVDEIPRVTRSVVDVRDVAFAHIAAFENPQASGRYTLVAASPTEEEIARAVKAARPNARVASKLAPGTGFVAKHCSSAKAEKELGIRFIPLEDMVRETCDSLTRIGLVSS
ncbi:hypothetical protein LEN26_019856 [Aphanomyces euteiches]|nr:hypothetical protein LEN26_019856 [Aphanomyces euteiches]